MHRIISVYGRKIFSVTLIFNALLTISCAIGLLWGFYAEHWTLYAPFLANGNLFWIAVIAAVINIFPAASLGRVHTGRLWFHHYVYGLFVLFLSSVWIVLFTSVSLLTVFFLNTSNLAVNAGRFFFIGGLTLVIDDLPDMHAITFKGVRWLKFRAHEAKGILHATQILLGFATLYLLITVSLSIVVRPSWGTVANFVQIGTLLVTASTCFASAKRRTWDKLAIEKQENHR